VIFLGGMDAVGGPMLKQMKELGIKAKFTTGDGGCSPELIKLAGAASEGVICTQAGLPPTSSRTVRSSSRTSPRSTVRSRSTRRTATTR
jgi:ABC-type branched-subunit amino acid transport system substrate-binding protein